MSDNPPIEGSLKLIGLKIQDFQCVECIDLTPSETVTEITGKNSAGKTTVIDAMAALLNAHKSKKPIRDGAVSSRLLADLGSIRLEQQYRADGTSRIAVRPVTNGVPGAAKPRPAEVLDQLYEKTTADPLSLYRLSPRDLMRSLGDTVGLTDKLDEMEGHRTDAYDKRTDINRELDRAEKQLQGLQLPPDDTPEDPVSVTSLMSVLETEEAQERGNAKARNELERLSESASRARDDLGAAEAILRSAQEELETAKGAHSLALRLWENARTQVADLKEPDTTAIKRRIANAETINRNVALREQRAKLEHAVANLRQKADAHTGQLTKINQEKSAAIAAAELPVKDLSFGPDGLIYRRQPLEQASTGERLRVCTELAINRAVKSGKPFKLLLLRNASGLDSDNRAVITDTATAAGFQTLIELLDESGQVGVYLEDGAVRAVNGVPVEAEVREPVTAGKTKEQ